MREQPGTTAQHPSPPRPQRSLGTAGTALRPPSVGPHRGAMHTAGTQRAHKGLQSPQSGVGPRRSIWGSERSVCCTAARRTLHCSSPGECCSRRGSCPPGSCPARCACCRPPTGTGLPAAAPALGLPGEGLLLGLLPAVPAALRSGSAGSAAASAAPRQLAPQGEEQGREEVR